MNLIKIVEQLTAKLSSIYFLCVVFVSPNFSVFSKALVIRRVSIDCREAVYNGSELHAVEKSFASTVKASLTE